MSQILNSDPEIEVMGTASDPVFAAKKIQAERPDVITLDVEMPRMDGLSFLKKLNALANPIPVVICSSKVENGTENALKAMDYGAAEIILKPQMGTKVFLQESKSVFVMPLNLLTTQEIKQNAIHALFPVMFSQNLLPMQF